MRRILVLPALVTVLVVPVLIACGDSGSGRQIQVTQTDDGCTPEAIDLQTGEHVTFVVKNDGDKDHEVEGINGTKLDEVLVPSGRTRNIGYGAPNEAGTATIKCYIPGGSTTLITLNISGESHADANATDADSSGRETDKAPNDTVAVKLVSYEVTADKTAVAAGPTKFVATNASTKDVHELAVLRVKDDGSFENTGEIEDIAPQASGEIVLDLPAGKYQLACLIVPGEAGSTVDHYQNGMHIDFEVK